MASQKKIKIDLIFDANTTAAQNNIQQLSSLLHQISTKTIIGVDGGSLSQAVSAAQQLEVHLSRAVNVDTGKLDLMKLRTDLKASGTDLQTLTNQLRAVGPTGEQAFLKMASAVSQAQVPMVKANGAIAQFMTTLANTAKWQIASTMIHKVMGGFQSATSHAKNLNKALTDIQIVTGYSTDYMDRFAKSAAKAAQELNTTVTEYAKAALIFYQQGLSGSAVEERASTVVKLAQVTGQTAQTVSDQMTAIWNNFHSGGQELEYYADVLTKLGAATAASSKEISDGLEKFAAVAKTVDLSYETAAAAVATVVDKTRQSADVVGTSFKTIFARMEGLSLGDTLEDGVNLNKYSEALEKVGVNVLNAQGELRSMDAILDDLGTKWQGLGEETQVALAQTVGGVRQYNQMMSLMNNWEDVKDNIELAKNATGELATQQAIWAKSYEGSLERLNQAKNELYEQFISDDMLKGINDSLTNLTKGFSIFIDQLGGVGPWVSMLILMFSKTLFPLMMNGFTRLGNTISVWSGKASRDVANMQNTISAELQKMVNNGTITNGMRDQLQLSDQLLRAKQQLMLNSKNMSASQRMEAESHLAVAESLMAETAELLKQQDALERSAKQAKTTMLRDVGTKKQLATNKVSADFRREQRESGVSDEETAAVLHNTKNYSMHSLSRQKEIDSKRVQEAQQNKQNADIAHQQAIEQEQAAQANVNKYQAELDYLNNFGKQSNVVANTAKASGKGRAITGYTETLADGTTQQVDAAQLEARRLAAQANLEKSQGEVDAAKKSAAASEAEIQAQQSIIQDGEKRIGQLEKALALKKKINEVTRDNTALEGAVVADDEDGGRVMSEEAGSENSARLHKQDQMVNQTQYNAEQSQMEAISSRLSGGAMSGEGALSAEASIANYEKLYQAIGEQAVMHSKLEGAAKEVGIAMQNLATETDDVAKSAKKLQPEQKKQVEQYIQQGKSLKGLSKEQKAYANALKAQNKSQQASIKTLKTSRSEYVALAKQAGLSDDGVKELERAFDQLGGTAEEQQAGLKAIEQTFKTLGIASDNVSTDLQDMANKMEQALLDAGLPDAEVKKLTASLKQLAAQAPQTQSGIQQTGNALDGLTNKAIKGANGLGQFSMKAMSVVGNVMSLTMGMTSMRSAFDSSLEPAERWQHLLSGLMGILPTVKMLTDGLTVALKSQTFANIKAAIAESTVMKAIVAKTTAIWAQVTANIANLFSSPYTMPLALVAIAAITATVITIGLLIKKTNENTAANYKLSEAQQETNKQTMDLAAKTAELADEWLNQMGIMDALIAKYNKLTEAEKQAAGSAEEILETVPDLIDAYDELAENVLKEGSDDDKNYKLLRQQLEDAAAKGNVEDIENITYEIDKLLSKPTSAATKTGVSAGTANALSSFYDMGLEDVHGIDSSNSNATKAHIFVEDLDTDSQIYGQLQKAGLTATRDRDGAVGLALETDNESFVQDYEVMKKVYEEAIKDPNMATDEGVQLLKTILDGSKDSYDQLKELYDSEQIQRAAEESLALGDLNDLEGYGDYINHRNQLINNLVDENTTWEQAEKYADEFLSENGATKDFDKMRAKWEALKNDGSDITQEKIAGLSEEDQKLFLELDINKYKTETAVETALDIAQAEADKKEITGTMNIVTTMKDTLKDDGMTSEDWESIKNSGFKWGEEGNIEFADFINMSYKEQQKYLEDINLKQQQNLILTKEKAKIETEAGLRALQREIESGTLTEEMKQQKIKEYDALVQNHKDITDELLIQKEVLENMEIAAIGLNADEVKTYAAHLQEVAKNSDEVSIHLKDNEEIATMVAKSTMRMNRGVEALNEGIMEWDDILKNSDKSSQEYSQALNELRTAMGDLLDVDEEFLSSEFLSNPENLELMKQAAEGSATAIDKLAKAAARDILLNIDMPDDVKTQMSQLHDELVQNLPDLKVGATVDESGFQELINSAKMSTEQAQAYFNALGYEPVFEMHEATSKVEKPLMTYTRDNLTYDEHGNLVSWNESVRQTDTVELEETTMVPTLSEDGVTPKIKTLTKTSSGSMNSSSAQNAGGSKAKVDKAKKIDKTDKSDVVDRYKEVTDALNDVEEAMSDVDKLSDRLYGPAKLKQMEKSNKLIKDKISLLEKQKKEAQANLEIDKKALGEAASEAGIQLQIDENGNIVNYTAEMTRLYDELARREAIADSYAGSSEEKQSEYIENNIEPLQTVIENLKSLMEQYEETQELLTDLDNQLDEEFYAWQDNNYEQLNYKLELQVEINDSDLEEIDYYLGKMESDFYKMAESAALLIDSSSALGKSKLSIYTSNYTNDSEYFNNLQQAFNNGEISQANFVEGMKEVSSNALADAQALQDLDDTMLEYYGNTLAMAGDELAKYTERMEHQTAILEHYKSIMDIIGESTDYEAMGIILEGQAKTIENELKVAKENYAMLAEEADYWKNMMSSVDETDPAFEVYKANWEAAEASAREAQDNMLSKTEEWAEAMKAVLENKLAGLAQTLENALTGGMSFDTITTQMERATSLQEEYLTTTNKIYHTNKMINTAQQAIDKTTNTVAKQKLKSFQQETTQLQQKKKLSQYELDIQQAKYDLLLAEIALEESQQTKSVVRLRRDSEGNFGYVYTANQDWVADAQQKVLDAQNALYNKGLEGANDYVQKYQQTMQEMYDTLAEIQNKYLNGEFETEEEYHRAMEEAKAYYYQKLQDYSSLYQVAITTDSNIIADAWSTDFADMTYRTEDWKNAVEDYVEDTNLAFDGWEETIRRIKEETVGKNLDELASKTSSITAASNELTQSVLKDGGLLDALKEEIIQVGNVTTKYATQRDMVLDLITKYELLAAAAKVAWQAQADIMINGKPDSGSGSGYSYTLGTPKNTKEIAITTSESTYQNDAVQTGRGGGKSNGGSLNSIAHYISGVSLSGDGTSLKETTTFKPVLSTTVTTYNSPSAATSQSGPKISVTLSENTVSDLKIDTLNKNGSFSYGGRTWYAHQDDIKKIENYFNMTAKKVDRGYAPGTKLKILGGTPVGGGKRSIEFDTVTLEEDGTYLTQQQGYIQHIPNDAKFTVTDYLPAKPNSSDAAYIGLIDGRDGLVKFTADEVSSFNTGGYTGSWGTEGKLAMLHQKELVLNPDDTTNFLASLEILREIINVIDLHSAHAQLSGLLSSPVYHDYNEPQTLEQQVHIEASFPSVTNHSEIEEAFNNLINATSQYINRK